MKPWIWWLVAACGAPGTPRDTAGSATPPSPPSPTTPQPAVNDPWVSKPPTPPKFPWTLVLESHYGPCDRADPLPCHKTWTATPDGAITRVETPNNGGPGVSTNFTLSPTEADRLRALVTSRDFAEGMANGFPCEGQAPEYDASLRLVLVKPNADVKRQYVLRCTRERTVPAEVVELIRR